MQRTAPPVRTPSLLTHLRRTLVAGLVALAAILVGSLPAGAAEGPCVASPSNGCITGTIRTAAGDPAVGVSLTIEGEGEVLTTVTGDDGTWSVSVSQSGDFAVTVDPETLPEGETLRDPDANPRTVSVALGSTRAALFPLGTPSGGTGTDGSASPSPTDSELEAPATPAGSTSKVAQQAVNGLIFGLLLALASVGLSLLYGTTGLSNFAHGEQVTLGAILAYVGTQIIGLPLIPAAILAILAGAASGWVQDAGIWHHLRRRRIGNTQQMIVTIGLSMVLQYSYQFFFGGGRLRIVIANPVPVQIGPVIVSEQSLISGVIAVITLIGVAYFLTATRTGRATRAVSDNAALASASGIGVERIIRLVWTLGAGLAALGGVLIALYFNSTSWNMGGTILLLMFAAVTLGGLGTAYGALAGSIIIGLVAEMSSLVIPSDMRYAGALLILIFVLLVRPQGILGRAERIG
ncbi:branched-chain amino acid ABC transporter permease [Actinotalea sp.]|uniref:branched-chain amino acid ABC transporter permease n=1 Tax=Actinotalea sp. TaxID=1872145 RepID=UPI00356B1883